MRLTPLALALPLTLVACTAAPVEPTPEPTTAAPADDCLIGPWTTAPGELQAFMDDLASERDSTVRVDGSMSVTFAADHSFSHRPDVGFTLQQPEGPPQPGSITGAAGGTWSTVDQTLLADVDTDSLDMTIELGDQIIGTDLFGWAELPITTSHYICGEGELTLTFNLGVASRPMKLIPST